MLLVPRLASVGKSLAVGLCATVGMIAVIEGWPVPVTLVGTMVIFALAGWFDAMWQRPWHWYSTLIMLAPAVLGFGGMGWIVTVIHLVFSPREIDSRNFYAFLPPIMLVGACVGALAFRRHSAARRVADPGRAA